uniref:2-oxoglutarate-dependent dioxygenase AOP3-like isoform X2 n=1 Tax=Nicotiana tabacum TaxID=4097 RepID=A0A1S4CRA6_TOBAC|nr:PREDICTED: 2-oxoglutarate-dependent dioxygenase AOP3-like isoform X2 [Nicotiana tabacum]
MKNPTMAMLVKFHFYLIMKPLVLTMQLLLKVFKAFPTSCGLKETTFLGLEIQTRDGQWLTLDFPPSSFVVMAGEAFRGWSNDRVLTPVHKVIMDISGNETRYTVGIFTFLKDNKMIEVAEELVDEEHPLQFQPFVHIDLIKFFDTERGRRSQNLVKDFCGV